MERPDYAFYRDTYGGVLLGEEDFTRLCRRAAERLTADTFGRCETAGAGTRGQVDLCLCAMAEALAESERGGDRLAAESLGSWSRSYTAPAGGGDGAARAERLYLADTGLLYRGAGRWRDG